MITERRKRSFIVLIFTALCVLLYSKLYSSRDTGNLAMLDKSRNLQEFSDECLRDYKDFCVGENNVSVCEEILPLTCCKTEITSNETICITEHDEEICGIRDICPTEFVPGGTGSGECFAEWERKRGASILIYLLLILYIFLAIAMVCDDYFVPSLAKISVSLNLSPDVAGATFMAAGTSAPELFVSFSDNVLSNPPKDLGTGTIIGSAIFNILIIIGLSVLVSKEKMSLDWRPLMRDALFYMVSIILLTIVVSNEEASWYEGLILLFVYGLYATFMAFNKRIFQKIDSFLEIKEEELRDSEKLIKQKSKSYPKESYWCVFYWPMKEDESKTKLIRAFSNWDELWKERFHYILTLPINLCFRFTIPDTNYDIFKEDKTGQEENRRIGFTLSFVISILWIAVLSHLLVYCATAWGCLVGLSPALIGLTLLAAGTSVPDALSSMIVARDGEGDMAVANAIGSNVFDILVGLGLPWVIGGLTYKDTLKVDNSDLWVGVGFLFGVIFAFLLAMFFTRWTLHKTTGGLMILFYIIYVVFEVVRRA